MPDHAPRLLVLGAHPDDAEYHAGGLCSMYRQRGGEVRMVSITDGSAGHYQMGRAELAAIRTAEAAEAGRVIGAAYAVGDARDGELFSNLEMRHRVIREIRTFRPDLVLTHRVNDYHPDHRATGQLVQDASYLVTVPGVLPEVPALQQDPVVAYMPDLFTKPCPLTPHLALDISGELDTIVQMLACHRSQVFDWLPWHDGLLETMPADEPGKLAWLRTWFSKAIAPRADRFRRELRLAFGEVRGAELQLVEVYEISEYAAKLDTARWEWLFPGARWVPNATSL